MPRKLHRRANKSRLRKLRYEKLEDRRVLATVSIQDGVLIFQDDGVETNEVSITTQFPHEEVLLRDANHELNLGAGLQAVDGDPHAVMVPFSTAAAIQIQTGPGSDTIHIGDLFSASGLTSLSIDGDASGTLPYTSYFVFGDSLSDNGNAIAASPATFDPLQFAPANSAFLAPTPPYFQGRVSNGPVWVEHLADTLGFDPTAGADPRYGNFAVSGATAGANGSAPLNTLGSQTSTFLTGVGGVASTDALYSVWAGANDMFALLQNPPLQILGLLPGTISNAVGGISDSITSLADAGARNFLVGNLVDLSRAPGAASLINGSAFIESAVRGAVDDFNTALENALVGIETANPQLSITRLDVRGLMDNAIADPTAFGVANVTTPAFSGSADLSVVANPDEYLFWDVVHPTRVGHVEIADFAVETLGQTSVDTLTLNLSNAGSTNIDVTRGLTGASMTANVLFAGLDGRRTLPITIRGIDYFDTTPTSGQYSIDLLQTGSATNGDGVIDTFRYQENGSDAELYFNELRVWSAPIGHARTINVEGGLDSEALILRGSSAGVGERFSGSSDGEGGFQLNRENVERYTFNASGVETLRLDAGADDDLIDVAFNETDLENIEINGQAGADLFITSSQREAIRLNGGDPAGENATGDTLLYLTNFFGGSLNFDDPADTSRGVFAERTGYGDVTFQEMEDVRLDTACNSVTSQYEWLAANSIDEHLLNIASGPSAGIYLISVTGAGLDPDAIEILDANGEAVTFVASSADLDGSTSYVAAELAPGEYRVRIRGQNASSGLYRLNVQIPGNWDCNGRDVSDLDRTFVESAWLWQRFGFDTAAETRFTEVLDSIRQRAGYKRDLDANLNGEVDSLDYLAAIANHDSTGEARISLTLEAVADAMPAAAVEPVHRSLDFRLSDFAFSFFRNPRAATDVNADDQITPLDALAIIGTLNNDGARSIDDLAAEGDPGSQIRAPFYDVDGNYFVTPLDALSVINDLNNNGSRPVAEGAGEPNSDWGAGADAVPALTLGREVKATSVFDEPKEEYLPDALVNQLVDQLALAWSLGSGQASDDSNDQSNEDTLGELGLFDSELLADLNQK